MKICSVDDCTTTTLARGWCRKHYYRWYRHGTLADPEPRTDITYTAAHLRVVSARGKAAGYMCLDCDGQADEWSYTGDDPDQLTDPVGRPYSLDTDRYVPRCRSCHRQTDRPRALCADQGCGRHAHGRGLCGKHYQRVMKLERFRVAQNGEAS